MSQPIPIHPHSLEAERAILGACIQDPATLHLLGHLRREHFYRPDHGYLWAYLNRLHATGQRFDELTLLDSLTRLGLADRCGGVEYVVQLSEAAPLLANAELYAATVLGTYAGRLRMNAGETLYRFPEDAKRVSTALQTLADAQAVQASGKAGRASGAAVMAATVARLEENAEIQKAGGSLFIPTGIEPLDAKAICRPQKLTILAGRPAMGKSAMIQPYLNGCIGMLGHKPQRCLIVSLEMEKEAIGVRLIADRAEIPYDRLERNPGSLTGWEWDKIVEAEAAYAAADEWWSVVDTPGLHIGEVAALARREAARPGGLGLLVLDYLTLLDFSGEDTQSRSVAVGNASTACKNLAKELGCSALVLAQLNRDNEKRGGDKRPQKSDLRDSGQIEQDADVIAFIHRPCVYSDESPVEYAELIIDKDRQGETGMVPLRFQGQYQRFSEWRS